MRRAVLTGLVLALLGATTAAFALTERLKLERSPIASPRFSKAFSPVCECPTSRAELAFTLRRADRLDAVVVDAEGRRVRTLAVGLERPRGRTTLRWNGRDDDGRLLPDGAYRLRVELDRSARTILIPIEFRIDTVPPRLRILKAFPKAVSPNGDLRNDRLKIVYRRSEPSALLIYADGRLAREQKPGYRSRVRFGWRAAVGGRPLEPGVHTIELELRDLAGNLSGRSEPLTVEVVGLALTTERLRVPHRGVLRFAVRTDAPFRWLLRRAGSGRAVVSGRATGEVVDLRLPRRVEPGRYVLEVRGRSGTDRTPVRVVRAPERPAR